MCFFFIARWKEDSCVGPIWRREGSLRALQAKRPGFKSTRVGTNCLNDKLLTHF